MITGMSVRIGGAGCGRVCGWVCGWVCGVDQRPLVEPLALRSGAGRESLPGGRRQPDGQVDRLADADPGGDPVILGHRQDEPDAAFDQVGAQLRIVAVDLVTGHPRRRNPSIQSTGKHHSCRARLGCELRVRRDTSSLAAVRPLGP
jgi:hypothetical protein